MSGNPFGPPDPEGDSSLGDAFRGGGVDPAPVHAEIPKAAPSGDVNAFESQTPSSFENMFGGAVPVAQEPVLLTPTRMFEPAVASPVQVQAVPEPVLVQAAQEPVQVHQEAAQVQATPELVFSPPPMMPPPIVDVPPPPVMTTPPISTMPPPPPPVHTFVPAAASPFGDANDDDDFLANASEAPFAPKSPLRETQKNPTTIIPQSPQSPKASVFVPVHMAVDRVPSPELVLAPLAGMNGMDAARDSIDDAAIFPEEKQFAQTSYPEQTTFHAAQTYGAYEETVFRPEQRTQYEPPHQYESAHPTDDFVESPGAVRYEFPDSPETKGHFLLGNETNETTSQRLNSVEQLANAASQAAYSATRLEQRVLELDTELEAYKVAESDFARELLEKDAIVKQLEWALEAERLRKSEKEIIASSVASTVDDRSVERLEKAKGALDRERAVCAKAEALAAAATRRAEELETSLANILRRLEEIESARVVAETNAREANQRAARAEQRANELATETSANRNNGSRGGSPRYSSSSPRSGQFAPPALPPPPVQLRVSVAADADELLARELDARKLSEESIAHRDAAARVVTKLVEENGTLMKRLESLGGMGMGIGSTSCDVIRETDAEMQHLPDVHETETTATSHLPSESSSPSFVPETPDPPKPRGLWAFITGADKAPVKYVPKKAVV